MKFRSYGLFYVTVAVFLLLSVNHCALAEDVGAEEITTIKSRQSGPWSAKETWDAGRVPRAGDRVVICAGDRVSYDVESRDVIRLVQIAGTLEFMRDRSTRLEAGLISIIASEEPSEEGFDCHVTPEPPAPGVKRPELLVGLPGSPIPSEHTATIRLHYIAGMNKESCPALINCGGRMELHGAPLRRTWVKMQRGSDVADTRLAIAESVEDWKPGDQIIVTSTERQRDRRGDSGSFFDRAQTEVRELVRVGSKDFTGGYPLEVDRPLTFVHYADGEFCAEVANLTRNVVIESADPDGVRGHTMVHAHSAGSVGYVEFRHLGKRGVLGRYALHYHLCGQTMRGSSVIGASIWDSHNRFLTIHGTDAMVVRDCVGYKCVGHGFFLEDGTEVNNVLDHNLAVTVGPGTPLPEQVIPFDPNRGAGFWFANCGNVFTRNVAAECAEYGYRFDCKEAQNFDPVLPIRQADGHVVDTDTRTIPFVRFQDNEAHTMKFFCLNLRGITRPEGGGLDFYNQNLSLAEEAKAAMPSPGHPFWIRDFKCWEANWAVHLGTTGVFVDGLNVYKSDVAIWRSIMDRSGYRRMRTKEMRVNDIHNPLSMGTEFLTEGDPEAARSFRGVSSFQDDLPPVTMITSVLREGKLARIVGTTADASDINMVTVNGREARSTRDAFSEWEVSLEVPESGTFEISAHSEDVNGHVEKFPHVIRIGDVGSPGDVATELHVTTQHTDSHAHKTHHHHSEHVDATK